MGKNTVEAKQWPDKSYGDSAPGTSTIIVQYAKFKRGRINTDDTERSGCPKSAVVTKNITKVHKIVVGDRKLKLRELADTSKIQKLNSELARLWHPYFGTRMVFFISTILRKVKLLTATITWDY